jgi:hypothetical protein
MHKVMLAVVVVALSAMTASAQQTWQLPVRGRNHGVVTGPGMPKCNPWVSDECRLAVSFSLEKGTSTKQGVIAAPDGGARCERQST